MTSHLVPSSMLTAVSGSTLQLAVPVVLVQVHEPLTEAFDGVLLLEYDR